MAFNKYQLHEHNRKRALHQETDPLTLDINLVDGAQEWSAKCKNENWFRHSNKAENLFKGAGYDPTALWYNEIR